MKWMFTASGDVSATPAVHGGRVYVPDWAGFLYALDRETGLPIWRASIAAASGVPGDKARTTPAVAGGKVYIGTQGPFGGGGKMLAFDADTGALIWSTQVDSHPADMDAIDALDLTTGAIRWAFEALPFDAWTVQCIFVIFDINEGNCPEPAGPDYDFGQAPPLYKDVTPTASRSSWSARARSAASTGP